MQNQQLLNETSIQPFLLLEDITIQNILFHKHDFITDSQKMRGVLGHDSAL